MKIFNNYSLKKLNTFGIEASAKVFVNVSTEDEMFEVLSAKEFKPYPKIVLGGGSNVLLTKDFNGLVIKNSIPGIAIIREDKKSVLIEAGAGVIWNDLVSYCVERNLGGIENLVLIPGTIGAAPIQNIGAYGQELSETFYRLRGFYIDTAMPAFFYKNECRFGYRDSIFKRELRNKFAIIKFQIRLNKNPVVKIDYGNVKEELEKTGKSDFTIRDVSEAIAGIRREKLPDPAVIGNAGSFFKNPEIHKESYDKLKEINPDLKGYPLENGKVKIPAAWLIEKAGFKGVRKGNTGTHARQPLVIINHGNASGEEILHFAKEIKQSVYEKFDVMLEEEVNIL
ncbi:MAG TPA: UDP-N-acetylmuramate dehydrogenase [Ignavibacteriaceae bacterium]